MDFLETVYAPIAIRRSYELPTQSKGVLILVPAAEDLEITTTIFSKMFGHLGYTMEESCHVLSILPNQRYSFNLLLNDFGFNKLILCGISPDQVGLQSSLALHTPVHLDGIFLLRTDAPVILEKSDKNHRGAFWNAFKSAFA